MDSMNDQSTFNGQKPEENLQENVEKEVYTLEAVSSSHFGLKLAELPGDGWINFSSSHSPIDKDDMQERLSHLQDNKDVWGGPIALQIVNTGTPDEPDLVFIDYTLSQSEIPDDFTTTDNDNRGSNGTSSEEEKLSLGDYRFDAAMEKLERYSNGHYSITTEILQTEPKHIVKAQLEIEQTEDGYGRGTYTGHGTDEDSQMQKQRLEVSETRAIKRAIKNSGALLLPKEE